MHEDNMPPVMPNPNRTPITVQKFEPIGGNKFKVKIKEQFINMKDVHIDGKDYLVTKRLQRGRYILVSK